MIKIIKISLFMFLLVGCQAHIGFAYHPDESDRPDVNLRSDLGLVRFEHTEGTYTFFYEHVSSITKTEEGQGLNMFGVMKRLY